MLGSTSRSISWHAKVSARLVATATRRVQLPVQTARLVCWFEPVVSRVLKDATLNRFKWFNLIRISKSVLPWTILAQ